MSAPVGTLFEAEMVRLYTVEQKTARQIAPIVGCSYVTVLKKLRKLGVEIRPATRRRVREYRLPHHRATIASEMMVTAIAKHHPDRILP